MKKKLIQLLVIDQDAQRTYRVDGDHFCGMLLEITAEERVLSLSERQLQCQSSK